jgi:hypothetical protein
MKETLLLGDLLVELEKSTTAVELLDRQHKIKVIGVVAPPQQEQMFQAAVEVPERLR